MQLFGNNVIVSKYSNCNFVRRVANEGKKLFRASPVPSESDSAAQKRHLNKNKTNTRNGRANIDEVLMTRV